MGLSTKACFLEKKSFESPIWRKTGGMHGGFGPNPSLLQENKVVQEAQTMMTTGMCTL